MNPERMMQAAGAVFVLLLWKTASAVSGELTIADPFSSFAAALSMLSDPDFLKDHLAVTVLRVITALLAGVCAGFLLGAAAGRYPLIRAFLEPLRRVLSTIPGVVAAVLAMLWFGLGSSMVIFLNTIFVAPVVYINVVESISRCDTAYLEAAQIYELSAAERLRHIYVPVIYSALSASLVVVTGNSMRLTVLAEVLGTGEGLGYILGISRARLDMPTLYGCVLICFLFVWLGEVVIKKLLFRCCHV